MLGSPAMDAPISQLCCQLSHNKFPKWMMWERNAAGLKQAVPNEEGVELPSGSTLATSE